MDIKRILGTLFHGEFKMSKRVIPFVLLIIVSCAFISVSAKSINTVSLCIYGETKEIITSDSDLEEILNQENINISKNDKIEFSPVKDGKGSINVIKRYEVIVKSKETVSKFLVEKATVKEAVSYSGIGYDASTQLLNLKEDEEILKDTTIEITEKPKPKPVVVEKPKTEEKTETTKKEETPKKETNKTQTNKTQTNNKTSNSPDKENVTIEVNGEIIKAKKMYVMKATAYTSGEDGGNSTATGMAPKKGVVAVDPKVIPLGTKLFIRTTKGDYVYGYAVAADTGGAIKGKKIDVFLETKKEVSNFGRRNVEVYVLS